ncbi:MAG TPA: 3-hydroxyacyl-CoA dehydrogenase [Casimicrobiaceae bacterium]|nr:3-hydroxyacyl-CoA dehydrogenase [Casimicrobiaceae bacterium]
MTRAAIVGAGLIGRAWAHVFARAGWQVRIWDPSDAQRAQALRLVVQSLHDLARHGLVDDPDAAATRVVVVATLAEAVAGADYVQESGPETLEAKRATFAQLDACAAPATILASSTSAIVASRFTAELAGRARCIVAHPVNPPHLVPVVELCGAPWTSAETRRRSREIMLAVGQAPVDVKREVDGFILNRLQAALLTEAFRLVQDGYVDPVDLDRTIADGLGLRWAFMGPFETIEMNAPGGIPDYCRRYVDWFRRYAADPAPVTVWDDANWQRAADAWPGPLPPDRVAAKSLWRDERLAALVAHKRGQPAPDV